MNVAIDLVVLIRRFTGYQTSKFCGASKERTTTKSGRCKGPNSMGGLIGFSWNMDLKIIPEIVVHSLATSV